LTFPIGIDQGKAAQGEFELQRRRWIKQLYDRLRVLGEFRKELNTLLEKKDHQAALDTARTGLAGLEDELQGFEAELSRLTQAARAVKLEPAVLSEGKARLKELSARRDELKAAIDNLTRVLDDEPRVQEAVKLVNVARSLRDGADFDQALVKYQEALAKKIPLPGVQEEFEKLQQAWALKGKDHEAARRFIYRVWPTLDSPIRLQEQLDEARKAFQVCKSKGDKLSPVMHIKSTVDHISKLTSELDSLQQLATEDSRKKAESILKLVEELKKLLGEMSAFLDEGGDKKP